MASERRVCDSCGYPLPMADGSESCSCGGRSADAALRARIEELEGALKGMMDGTDCRLDHHGLCQAHGWNDDGDCPERRARRAL